MERPTPNGCDVPVAGVDGWVRVWMWRMAGQVVVNGGVQQGAKHRGGVQVQGARGLSEMKGEKLTKGEELVRPIGYMALQ